ncbi:hypothetical protein [Thioalkalivibrio sp.]|uniref:hypothetical protein n=1 Tax=Thioalkalivibrio sp. TaxID=2093813 RepID=UPI0039750FEB
MILEAAHVEPVLGQIFSECRCARCGGSDDENDRLRCVRRRRYFGTMGMRGSLGLCLGAFSQLRRHFLDPCLAQRHHQGCDGLHLHAREWLLRTDVKLQVVVQTSHAVEKTVYSLVPELVHEPFRTRSQILDFRQQTGPFSDDVPMLDQILELLWQLPQEFGLYRANYFKRGALLVHAISNAVVNTMAWVKRKPFQPSP